MIKIDGLTLEQRCIADMMWNMETQEEVHEFIQCLDGEQQRDAVTVLKMIMWAMLDDVMDTDLAQEQLQQFML
jgi:hypothetical protein